jgi:CRISPR-associated endonuclease/helicase Cas3
MTLSLDDFTAFFEEVHGSKPFPWQERLLRKLANDSEWPGTLALPTGSGKTAAIDIAVFHLALEAERGRERRAAVRVAFVVDRRLVVDDAFERARKLASALNDPNKGPSTSRVAEQLRKLSVDGPALIARRLRGGIPREDDWARTPSQPTVLCSTVDQIGSRLLFRGYGVSDSMKPVHAGLIGSDCLILLDEAHLSEPFRQTLGWVQIYQGQVWRQADTIASWGVAHLTATPSAKQDSSFSLDDEDRAHPVLARRLNASKHARLVAPSKPKTKSERATETHDDDTAADKDLGHRAAAVEKETWRAFKHFETAENGVPAPAIAVVVNRVARARAVFERLKTGLKERIENGVVAEPVLMIGPARPLDREDLVKILEPIRTGTSDSEKRGLNKALIVVATQCIEAGVDVDFDALISEAAPLDALRQRFGRLNRAGRDITPYAAIVAMKSDLSARDDDPVYGKAIKCAWNCLADRPDGKSDDGVSLVDFGLNAFATRTENAPVPAEALSPRIDAPVLLPAHVDLLSQTSPIPAVDPDVALYLHGKDRQPDSITVVWRADIDPVRHPDDESTRRLLMLVPPRASEAIQLPLWTVRRWLSRAEPAMDRLADIADRTEDNLSGDAGQGRRVFRWKGDDERSKWIVRPSDVRPGDTIVAPASEGGADQFGWNPASTTKVSDKARTAAEPFTGRRFAVRAAPGLLGDSVNDETLANALASAASQRWQDVRSALLDLDLPDLVRDDLKTLDDAVKSKVVAYIDLYGTDDDRPRGVVFVAPFGIRGKKQEEQDEGRPNATEDDATGSTSGFSLRLDVHCDDVAQKAEAFASRAGLPAPRVADLKLAAHLHDSGKTDSRFQAWLYYGDPFGPEPDHILAKSDRFLPRVARHISGLPERWRHEALSVRLARSDKRIVEADDAELVLWLIGSHHGHGRPFFPHRDPVEKTPDVGPQSLAFDWLGFDWPALFARLKARYGIWELARMEAILRLADHRASEEEAVKADFR